MTGIPHRLLAVALVVALVATTSPAAAATVTIDQDNALATDEAIRTFESEGVVTRNVGALNLSVTVAQSHDDVDVVGPHTDVNNVWLRLDYDEEIERTIRLYLPGDYFKPRVNTNLRSMDGSVTASLTPVEGADGWTAVELHVEGPTDATFAVSKEAGAVFDARSFVRDAVNNTTGVSLPAIGATSDWQYISARRLAGNETVRIEDTRRSGLTLQYDDGDVTGEAWLPVPDCEDPSTQRVCYYEDGNATVVLAATEDPPQVRYKRGTDFKSTLGGAWNDLVRVPDRISDLLDGLFG